MLHQPALGERSREVFRHIVEAYVQTGEPIGSRTLSRRLAGFSTDSGAIYRALRTLEEQGDIQSSWDTSQTGPARKIYQLTAAGRAQLAVLAEDIRYRMGLLATFLASYEELPPLQS